MREKTNYILILFSLWQVYNVWGRKQTTSSFYFHSGKSTMYEGQNKLYPHFIFTLTSLQCMRKKTNYILILFSLWQVYNVWGRKLTVSSFYFHSDKSTMYEEENKLHSHFIFTLTSLQCMREKTNCILILFSLWQVYNVWGRKLTVSSFYFHSGKSTMYEEENKLYPHFIFTLTSLQCMREKTNCILILFSLWQVYTVWGRKLTVSSFYFHSDKSTMYEGEN
jgi:hypothetical protein